MTRRAPTPLLSGFLHRIACEVGRKLADDEVEVVAEIGIGCNEKKVFVLRASFAVMMAEFDQAKADSYVRHGHERCSYSNAIRGNVDVQMPTTVR